jgi:hypothetical protein
MEVAELVPQVAALDGGAVGASKQLGACCGLEQLEVRGRALVPAGEEAVDGTQPRSGTGGSPCSCEETPVCRITGATRIPPATSAVTSSVVKGRAALGISALPGWRAKTVW